MSGKLVLLLAANGAGAGKSACAKFFADKYEEIHGAEAKVYPKGFATSLKTFLTSTGLIGIQDAYSPEGKAKKSKARLCDIPVLDRMLPDWKGISFIESVTGVPLREAIEKVRAAHVTVRGLLQLIGTEVIRDNLGENTWVRIIADSINKGSDGLYLIDDTRFANELGLYQYLDENVEFRSVYIWRDEAQAFLHASEGSIHPDECDYTVYNAGTLEETKRVCEGIMVQIIQDGDRLTSWLSSSSWDDISQTSLPELPDVL